MHEKICRKLARLEEWGITTVLDSPYQSPEQARPVAVGKVYNHQNEKLADGKVVTTGTIQDLDIDGGWLRTGRTIYYLGAPSDKYILHLVEVGSPSLNAALSLKERAKRCSDGGFNGEL